MPYKTKEAQQARDRRYYSANRERIKERVKSYARRNREKIAADYKKWRQKNNDEYNAYHRKWRETIQSPESKNRERERTQQWRKKNPQKLVAHNRRSRERNRLQFRARMRVSEAVQHGRLIRPTKCCECGKDCRPHAHHADYTKPLEVIWLCHACHVKAHDGSFHNSLAS